MEGGEILNFVIVWLSVLVCLCYCYAIRNKVPKGIKKLLLLLPVICFFIYLPLNLSTVHLSGITAFFVAWLANFKLLLFAFGKGPLSSHPSISFPLFLAVSCFPIKIQKYHNQENTSSPTRKFKEGTSINYAIKGLALGILVRLYDYSDQIPPKLLLVLYSFHVYFFLELILAMAASLARTTLGLELEPQFNEPYLATSLQDFWGKRWNLMVTGILRPTVYEPTFQVTAGVVGRKWAQAAAVIATFWVSGVMHELMFYYIGCVRPTWELMWFFLLHGVFVTVEVGLKRAVKDRWQQHFLLYGVMSRVLALGFVMITAIWLFLPRFLRCEIDVRAFEEYAALGAFARDLSRSIMRVLGVN